MSISKRVVNKKVKQRWSAEYILSEEIKVYSSALLPLFCNTVVGRIESTTVVTVSHAFIPCEWIKNLKLTDAVVYISQLYLLNLLSVICVVFLSGVVIYKSIINDVGGPVDSPKNPLKWWPDDFGGLLTAISIAGLTFSCHFNILPMHGELRYQTRANKRIILYTAMGITYTLNVLVSFFGFFQVS